MKITKDVNKLVLSLLIGAFLLLLFVSPDRINAANGSWDNTSNDIWYEDGNVVVGSDETPNGLFEVREEAAGRTEGMFIVDPDSDGSGGSGDGAIFVGQLSTLSGDSFEAMSFRDREDDEFFRVDMEDKELKLMGHVTDGTPLLHFRENNTGKDWVFINEGNKLIIADETNANPSDDTYKLNRIMGIENDGDVRISRSLTVEQLHVESDVVPDYVFADDYDLMSLPEVASFIDDNRHLPGVTAATTTGPESVDIGERSRQLLEKLEELYLYTIRQQEEIDYLKSLL